MRRGRVVKKFVVVRAKEGGGYLFSETQQRWEVWAAAKREASTEPSAIRDAALEEAAQSMNQVPMWSNCSILISEAQATIRSLRAGAGAGALPDEAKDAALIEVGGRLAGALEVLSTAMRNNGSSEFVSGLVAEWRAAAIEAQAKAGKGEG